MIKFRFSLKLLMLMVTLVAIVLAVLLHRLSELSRVNDTMRLLQQSEVVLTDLGEFSPSILDRVVSRLFGVEILDSYQRVIVQNQTNLSMLSKLSDLPHVEVVHINECELGDLNWFHKSLSIKEVALNKCKLSSLEGIGNLVNLEVLSIERCNGLESIHSLADVGNTLQKLNVNCVISSPLNGGKKLSELKLLRELSFDESSQEDFENICDIESLRCLRLGRCFSVTDLQKLRQLKHLEHLSLSQLEAVEDLDAIGKAKSLKSLSLSNCTLGANSLQKFKSLTSLERLAISFPKGSIENLSGLDKLRSLVSFRLYPASELNDLSCLVDLPCLEMLDLSGYSHPQIDQALHLPRLRVLSLRECPKLTSLAFLENSKDLEVIEVDNCPQLSDVEALDTCEKLNKVFARGCPLSKQATSALNARLDLMAGPLKQSGIFHTVFDKLYRYRVEDK